MADYPALPLWTDAYLGDTPPVSPETWEHHGIYLLLLMKAWRTPGCRLPNDKKWLALHFGCSVEVLEERVMPVLQTYFKCSGHYWTQKRLSHEDAYLRDKSDKQSKRAKSRWEKEKGTSRSDNSASQRHMPKRDPAYAPTPTPTPTDSPLPPHSGANGSAERKEGNFDEEGLKLAKWFYARREHHFPHTADLPNYSATPTVMTSLLRQGLPAEKIQEVLDVAMASEAAKGKRAPSSPKAYPVSLDKALRRHHEANQDAGAPSEADLEAARRVQQEKFARQRAIGEANERLRAAQLKLMKAVQAEAPEEERQALMDERDRLIDEANKLEQEAAQ